MQPGSRTPRSKKQKVDWFSTLSDYKIPSILPQNPTKQDADPFLLHMPTITCAISTPKLKPSQPPPSPPSPPTGLHCQCTKNGCQKNYCECFRNGSICTKDCNCKDCRNTDIVICSNIRKKNKLSCNCSKSTCVSKYCQCRRSGRFCGELCRCHDCQNGEEGIHKEREEEVRDK